MNSYLKNLRQPSDMQGHLGFLRGLSHGLVVVELGFRTGISTSAFLAGAKFVTSYDINVDCKKFVRLLAKEYPRTFSFKVGDSTKIDIPECDLLFLDTDHTYKTTYAELKRHYTKARKWIVLHDTVTFGKKDKPPGKGPGIQSAMWGFLEGHRGWEHLLHLPHCNGLDILRKVS